MIRVSPWVRSAAVAALMASVVMGVETKTWTQSEAAEFDKGILKGLALRSDGHVTLAPMWNQVFDTGVAQVWCAASDSKGTLYAGASEGKVFAVDPAGKGRLLATLEGGSVYAIAVNTKNEVFAALSPDARILKLDAAGKSTVFATLKARYVWALVPAADGALYAATGDPGQIHRIGADGTSTLVFDAAETHVRSLALDPKGNLIAGTEPGGLVLRVSPKGEGFVLYQTAKREVTSIAVARDGTIYASATGNRGAVSAVTPATMVPAVQTAIPAAAGAQGQAAAPRPLTVAPPPTFSSAAPPSGGMEIYSIGPDGEPRKLMSSANSAAYAIALDAQGKPIVGTGNEGRIYRVESEFTYTRLVRADVQQVTAFVPGPKGGLRAVTSNPGRIFELGPELNKSGSIESDLFDATAFTFWGRLRFEGDLNGGSVSLETRSGNWDRTQSNWSPWNPVDPAKGSRIQSPPARFLAWRATLTASANVQSPELKLVEAAYQAKNVAPAIERIEVVQPNYKFQSSTTSLTSSSSLSLPPIGQAKRSAPSTPTTSDSGSASLTYDHGYRSARWKSSDANGDTLEYTVQIKGEGEREWKTLKDKLKDARLSWDASALADGAYRLRVSVTDEIDNYPGQALTATAESEPFVIDNTAPKVSGLTAKVEGGKIQIRFHAADASSSLQSAECSVNGGEWNSAPPSTRITDSQEHDYSLDLPKPAGTEFTIAVRVMDEFENVVVEKVVLR